MAHLLEKHYTEEVTAEEQLQKDKWYPPYHPVFHPHKPSNHDNHRMVWKVFRFEFRFRDAQFRVLSFLW